MDDASAEGHVAALRWLRERGIVLDSSTRALDRASMNGHTETVAWWLRNLAATSWWSHSGLPLKYSSRTVKAALNAGLLSVLYQWRERERTEERRSQGDEQEVQQQHDPSSADAGAGAASDNVETAIVDVGEVPQIRAQFLQELEEWVASFPPELPFSNYRPMSPTSRCTSPTSPTHSPTYSPTYWRSSPVEPTALVYSSVNSPTSPTTYL
ncbi:hypothetical protein DFJ73DRAFT_833140 [Zopfochytrium polystomum]|nr:hypothetical protein DFJ73DRAFT_833140 [Zopfochytrium polystomum]